MPFASMQWEAQSAAPTMNKSPLTLALGGLLAMAAGIGLVFCGVVGYAKLSYHWETLVPARVYQSLIPASDEVSHPMPGDEALR